MRSRLKIRQCISTIVAFGFLGISGICNGGALAQTTAPNPRPPNIQHYSEPFLPYDQAMQSLQSRSRPVASALAGVRARASGPSALSRASVVGGTSLSTLSLSCSPPSAPAELVELARALKYDPDLIYEYVYNNITTLPQYGSLKGPLGTFLDRMGTPFDEAELMYVLLEQSCFSPSYEIGRINLTAAQLNAWLGTNAASIYSVSTIMGFGGFSGSVNAPGGTISSADLSWAWLQVAIGGVNYVFDPSAKIYSGASGYSRASGISSLATALSYSQSTFLSDAESGASIASTTVSSLNTGRTNLRSDLTSYANNLVSYIKTNLPTGSTNDLIGGKTITPLPVGTHLRQTSLPYGGTATNYTTMPATYRTTLTVTLPGTTSPACSSVSQTFYSSTIYGGRLSLFFDGSNHPVLSLDGATQLTGCAQSVGVNVGVSIAITHPYPTTFADLPASPLNVLSGGTYVIDNGWGQMGRAMIEKHRKLLIQNQAANPSNPSAEPVLGESLSNLGFMWLAEFGLDQLVTDQIAGTDTVYHHAVGIVGMRAVGASVGPYVDLPYNGVSLTQRLSRPYGSGVLTPIESSAFFSIASAASVLESGTLEQTQPGAVAVSTVKLFDINSQSGTFYDINNNNISGDDATYYMSTIRPLLVTTYGSDDLNRIDTLVGTGMRVIAPLNGALSASAWTGVGYYQISQDGTYIGAIITGGLSGGFTGTSVTQGAFNANGFVSNYLSSSTPQSTVVGGMSGGSGSVYVNTGDPVNQVTGDYLYRHMDISVGSGDKFPYQLSFERSYDSGRGQTLKNGPLGLGWTHNFAMSALPDSDGFEGLGQNSAINAAAAIAAIYVTQDVLNGGSTSAKPLDRIVLASEINRWMMDQLTTNIVAVTQPGETEHFTKLADGTYNPPLGSASTLTLSSGAYTFTAKDQTVLTFNTDGTISSWHSPAGPTVSFSYTSGNLTSVSNGMNRTLTLSYTGNQITGASDGTGRSVSYGYDSNSNLTSYTDVLSHSTAFVYGSPGQMTQVKYPSEPTTPFVTNNYDTLGRVETQQDANSNTTTYYFAGTRTEVDDALSNAHVDYFSARGKTLTDIDALNNQTLSTYDGLDRLSQMTLPEGNYVSVTYDAKHNVLTQTNTPKSGSGLTAITKTFTYDSTYNKVHTAQDENGNTTTYNYDSSTGNLLTVVQPTVGGSSPTTTYTYNSRGQVTDVQDPTGKVGHNVFSATDESLTNSTDDYSAGGGHLNLLTQFGYDSTGNITSKTDPNGNQTTYSFDASRRVIQATGPAPSSVVTTYAYDNDGNLLATTVDPRSGAGAHKSLVTASTYTPTFKLNDVTDPSGNRTSYHYNSLDQVDTVTDAESRVTSKTYDATGRLSTVTNTAIQSTPLEQYTYTNNGKTYQFTDARAKVTTYTYDGFDRSKRATFPDSAYEENTSYDSVGNILTKRTRSGNTITFTYDALNRIATKAPQSELVVTYAYDLAGRITSVSDSNGTFTYGFDTAKRVTSETRPDSKVVGYQLDYNGNRTRITWPDSYYVTYSYDEINRLTSVLESGTTAIASYTYDPASRRTQALFGNSDKTNYSYANDGDVTSIATLTSSNTTLFSFTYGYNKVHQRTSASVSDSSYLLLPSTAASISYTSNDANSYTAVGSATPSYDGNGNLTGDGVNTYTYDTENRVLTFSKTGTSASYVYDPLGRRGSKTVNSVTTSFLSAGAQEIAEYDNSGSLARRYIFGPGIDEVILRIDCSGSSCSSATKYYNHQDGLGSVVALTNGSSAVAETDTYDPFGGSSTTAGNPFRFAGRRLDAESGLYYYRARYYSPALGRFLSDDPIGYDGGKNLYAYVGNDPVNETDPLGLYTLQIGGNIGISLPSGWSVTGYAGVAVDTSGGVAGYYGGGLGYGSSTGASMGAGGIVSNAKTVNDLGGPFVNVSGGVGTGGHVGVDTFYGASANGVVTGVGVSGGVGIGTTSYAGPTDTVIRPLTGSVTTPQPSTPTQSPSNPGVPPTSFVPGIGSASYGWSGSSPQFGASSASEYNGLK